MTDRSGMAWDADVGDRQRRLDARFVEHLSQVLDRCHERGVVNERALLDALEERSRGIPLRLDRLAEIFGVETIYALLTTSGPAQDRALLQAQLDSIRDALVSADLEDPWSAVSATLQLITVLTDALCARPRWWP
jgi:hypothetical protein